MGKHGQTISLSLSLHLGSGCNVPSGPVGPKAEQRRESGATAYVRYESMIFSPSASLPLARPIVSVIVCTPLVHQA
jgi:hypothetical protein